MNFQLSEVGLTSKWVRISPAVQWCHQKQSNISTWCLITTYNITGGLQHWPKISFHTIIHHSSKTDSKLCERSWKDMKGLESTWRDLEGLKRTWKDMKGLGRNWKDFIGFESTWRDLKGLRRIWKELKGVERAWKDLKGPGRTWKNLRGLGRTWQNWKELESIERSARSGKVWQKTEDTQTELLERHTHLKTFSHVRVRRFRNKKGSGKNWNYPSNSSHNVAFTKYLYSSVIFKHNLALIMYSGKDTDLIINCILLYLILWSLVYSKNKIQVIEIKWRELCFRTSVSDPRL